MKHKILCMIVIIALLTGVLSIATSATSVGDTTGTTNSETAPLKISNAPNYFIYKGSNKTILVEDASYMTRAVASQPSGSTNGYTIRYGARDVTANSVYNLNAYVNDPSVTGSLAQRFISYEAYNSSNGLYKGGSMQGVICGYGQFVTSAVETYEHEQLDGTEVTRYIENARVEMNEDENYVYVYTILIDYFERDVLGNLSRRSILYSFNTSLGLDYPFVSAFDDRYICLDRNVLAQLCGLPVGTPVTSLYVDVDIVSANNGASYRARSIDFLGDFVSPSLDAQYYGDRLVNMSHSDEEVNRSFVDWIFTAIGAFFSYPMFYVGTVAVTPYAIFAFVLGFACVMWLLKLFNGG